MKRLSLFVASLLLPAVALAQAGKPAEALTAAEVKEADAAIKAYFEGKTDADREAAVARMAAIDHPSKADIGKLSAKAFQWTKAGPRLIDKPKVTCTDPERPGEFEIQVASGAKKGQPTGVCIILHGGGAGVGDSGQIRSLLGAPGPGMTHVWPTVMEKTDSAWNTEREEQYVLAILDDLKRTYAVDTNRVYIAGHSMGGYGTWSIGPRHADLFAAGAAMAGGIFVGGKDGDGKLIIAAGILPNLKNMPFWFYNSTDDKQVRPDSSIRAAEILEGLKKEHGAFDFVFKKYADIGHGLPKEGCQEIWKFMFAKKRDPLPKRVMWEPSRSYKQDFYWIHSTSGGGKFDVERDGNKFTVREGASSLSIYLNDKMVKFDQPVVVVDGSGKELFNAPVKPSLAVMLDSIGKRKDPEMWFTARIDLK